MLRRDGIDAATVDGHYGELTVLVDGEPVLSAGPLGFIGVLPSLERVRDAVRRKLADRHVRPRLPSLTCDDQAHVVQHIAPPRQQG